MELYFNVKDVTIIRIFIAIHFYFELHAYPFYTK